MLAGQMNDVEAGRQLLYLESPELRWSFIRRVYAIITVQLFLTVVVADAAVDVHQIPRFFSTTKAGLAIYIVLLITPFITMVPLVCYHKTHPLNYFLLGLFTLSVAFPLGLTCAFPSGKVLLVALMLTAPAVFGLILKTFCWESESGKDFSFWGPFLHAAMNVLVVFGVNQFLCPIEYFSMIEMILGCLVSLVFSGYIIYDTNNLIQRFAYDEYIVAAATLLGPDVINLFMALFCCQFVQMKIARLSGALVNSTIQGGF